MALLLVEGWDHNGDKNAKGWSTAISGAGATDQSGQITGRLSGSALRVGVKCGTSVSPAGINVEKGLPSTYSTAIVGFAFRRLSSTPAGTPFYYLLTSAGAQVCALQFNGTTFVLEVINASGGLVVSSARSITQDTWYYYEVKVFVNGASGTVEVQRDGGAEIASTTGNFGSTNIGRIRMRTSNSSTNGVSQVDFDDMVVLDTSGSSPQNTFIGDVRVETIFPTGAGNTTQWTPNSGSNWDRVDDVTPDDDTTYVEGSTTGTKDTYATGNLSSTSGNVFGVQINMYAKKTDAGTKQIRAVVRQGGTDYDGVAQTLTTSYGFLSEIQQLDPTVSAWTPSNINSDEFGVKVV